MKALIYSEWERVWTGKRNACFLLFCFCSFWFLAWSIQIYKLGFIQPTSTVPLNAWNFAWFTLRELGVLINYIFVPALFFYSLRYEQFSGAYRMYCLRPYSFFALYFSKWVVMALYALILVLLSFSSSVLYGYLFCPKPDEFVFLAEMLTPEKAVWITVKFYAIFYLILLSLISIIGFLECLFASAALNYFILLIGLIIGFIYPGLLANLALSAQAIYDFSFFETNPYLILISIATIALFLLGSFVCTVRRDYRY